MAPGDGSPAAALALAAAGAFVTMCIGAFVSSSHAGLACTTFPACNGTLLGSNDLQLAQMLHRLAAGIFFALALFASWSAMRSGSARVGAFARLGLILTILQICLGIANVVWSLPMVLREAHAANAGLTFLAFVVAAVLAVVDRFEERSVLFERGLSSGSAVYAAPRR